MRFEEIPGALRAILEDIDAEVRQVESNILEGGGVKDMADYARLRGMRTMGLKAREIVLARMDKEIAKRLG